MKLEVGKTYITAAGYVVPIVGKGTFFISKIEYCAGTNERGESAKEHGRSWEWDLDGKMEGLSEQTDKDMTIVGEIDSLTLGLGLTLSDALGDTDGDGDTLGLSPPARSQ